MNSRERVLNSIEFKPVDRVPVDLGGMASTSISAFAHPKLREYLGLKKVRSLVYDTGQMLALPEKDLLDMLGVDVVTTNGVYTNAFDCIFMFQPFDFNKRLYAAVWDPSQFQILPDGTILQGASKMPPSSVVFDSEHGGNPIDLSGELEKIDLSALRRRIKEYAPDREALKRKCQFLEKVRSSTDRAVFLNGDSVPIGLVGGLANGTMLCVLEPEYMHELNKLYVELAVKQFRETFYYYKDYVDIVMLSSNDLGTQNTTYMHPDLIDELFFTYYKQIIEYIKSIAPHVKLLLHSCGAIYDLIDIVAKSGFDILNPVQWTAGGRSYKEWKDRARRKICLWGGGVDSQYVLPLGTPEEVYTQAKEVASYMIQDSGFVFCNIHNLLAEVPSENIVALYKAAADTVVS
jgi:uroporphyrinogen decarboxylase